MLARSLLPLVAALCVGCAGPPAAPAADARYMPSCGALRPPAGVARADSVRALVVFVRFADDQAEGSAWPSRDADGRRLPLTALPPYAETYFEPHPERVAALPLGDRSLSAWFYHQSKNGPGGPHVLAGEIWPRDAQDQPYAFVPSRPNRAYHNRAADGTRQAGGYGYLTAEVLETLAADPRFDPAAFDATCDGQLDHLMLIVRRDVERTNYQGWAALGGLYEQRGQPQRAPIRLWSASRQDSVTVSWSQSGSQTFAAAGDPFSTLVHEYLHLQLPMGHITMIQDNDVPARTTKDGAPSDRIKGCAYARMCGTSPSGSYDAASATLSGFEMRRAGWARTRVLDPADGDRPGVRLEPLFSTGDLVLVPLPEGSPADTLSLENRQPISPYDRLRGKRHPDPYYGTIYYGLGSRGLLATLSRGDPQGLAGRYRYDVLFADDAFDLDSWCDGTAERCAGPDLYSGDTYRPGGTRQLSPWTRPGTTGYSTPPPGASPVWLAVDDVREDADGTVTFDFVADVRRGFTVRTDSWMGHLTRGQTLGAITVEPGATLTVETDVTFADGLTVARGARLVAAPGAVLRFAAGTALRVEGTLSADGARFTGDGWAGIVRARGASVSLGSSAVDGAR